MAKNSDKTHQNTNKQHLEAYRKENLIYVVNLNCFLVNNSKDNPVLKLSENHMIMKPQPLKENNLRSIDNCLHAHTANRQQLTNNKHYGIIDCKADSIRYQHDQNVMHQHGKKQHIY